MAGECRVAEKKHTYVCGVDFGGGCMEVSVCMCVSKGWDGVEWDGGEANVTMRREDRASDLCLRREMNLTDGGRRVE
jgi:hypothetical protein